MTGRISFKTLLILGCLTLGISIARMVVEVQSNSHNESGGEGFWLGITWLVPILGLVFGWILAGGGSRPRSAKMMLVCSVITIGVVLAVGMVLGSKVKEKEIGFETLLFAMIGALVLGAILMFATWPRLATTMLIYGVLARLGVLAITWLCLAKGWDTHYVRFGPPEAPIVATTTTEAMEFAATAQLGLWIPFTITAGTICGGIAAVFRRKR